MDKIDKYREIVVDLLNKQPDLIYRNKDDEVGTYAIFDDERAHYMIFRSGWWGKKRIHSAILYIRLHEGKIWLEEDWTEDGITPALLDAGIPKKDIVLGFRHPQIRPLTEFAIA